MTETHTYIAIKVSIHLKSCIIILRGNSTIPCSPPLSSEGDLFSLFEHYVRCMIIGNKFGPVQLLGKTCIIIIIICYY